MPTLKDAAPAVRSEVRRSPSFGFDRIDKRIVSSSTPTALAQPVQKAVYPSSFAPVVTSRPQGAQSTSSAAALKNSGSGAFRAVEHYMLPSLSLLDEAPAKYKHDFVDKSELLIRTLASFKVEAKICNVVQGPAITRYELEPAVGVRVKTFTGLADDIALALAATTVRIEAPVPGKSVVGVEVPNGFTELVSLREVLSADKYRSGKGLCVGLGKDISGAARVADLTSMPHLLVAGTTGSGKSVCINTLILSLLYRFTPRHLQLMLIDPKQVELSIYEGLPHLVCLSNSNPGKIIVDPKMASSALRQMVNLMEERYTMLSKARVRNINEYNLKHPEAALPWVVVIIDELADLMMVASKDVERSICRLAQKARAAGIHMVVATQRPSTDVITGLLKVNIPSRIAFAVSSNVDSRVILDDSGAEHLLGKGDMLFKPVEANRAVRIQGAFVKNEEIQRVVEFWNKQDAPANRIELNIQEEVSEEKEESESKDGDADEPLLEEALEIILRKGQASASMLQTEMSLGYARARRLINKLEKRGYVGPADGSKARKILYTNTSD
ncbi:MAG: DNA translocase FtsK [Candidatus Bruticola sp.]